MGVVLIGVLGLRLQDFKIIQNHYGRQLLIGNRSVEYPVHITKAKPYDNLSIIQTQKYFEYIQPLLIFDGSDNTFKSFVTNNDNARRISIPYVISYGLRNFFPERFQKGQPSFQIMFGSSDTVLTSCHLLEGEEKCDTRDWSPYILFGSVPKDKSIFPSLVGFPPTNFVDCFADLNCGMFAKTGISRPWDDLIPTIIWRGSDFPFLQESHLDRAFFFGVNVPKLEKETATKQLMEHWDGMTPRWRGAMLSLLASQEEVPWIDVKFVMSQEKLDDCKYISYCSYNKNLEFEFATSHYMGEDEQIKYKYHIDLGGGGGTTWTGTFRKLAMPGVLFHHETKTKDWFYDEIKPWIHYIPIEWDLSDLREKYEWAEANPEECQAISQRATDFFLNYRGRKNIQDLYHRLFQKYLGSLVDAYVPKENNSVQDILNSYKNQEGFEDKDEFYPFGTCDEKECFSQVGLHTLKYEILDKQLLTQGGQQTEEKVPDTKVDLDIIMISEELDEINELLLKSQQTGE